MDDEIKRRWIAKLESGDYAQTTSTLADDTGYCCLGVLCEIAVEDGIVIKTTPEGQDRSWYTSKLSTEDTESSILPDVVVKWARLNDNNPSADFINDDDEEENACLAEMNDAHMPFWRIAQVIEQNF